MYFGGCAIAEKMLWLVILRKESRGLNEVKNLNFKARCFAMLSMTD